MRLALLSDLHFGRAQPDLIDPLLAALEKTAPDQIVIAGDFVQRTWPWQYRAARDFVDRLQAPWIAVPGNHDIPLFNVVMRAFRPRHFFRHYITEDTEPFLETDGVVIVGLDTTYRFYRERGLIRPEQVERVSRVIRENAAERAVIIVAHHPFHHGEDIAKRLMAGAPDALETWADAGPHVILTGHLHRWLVEPFISRKNRSATLQVHCGTGLSTRRRGEPNEFALLDIAGQTVGIRRMVAQIGGREFAQTGQWTFRIEGDGWVARSAEPQNDRQ
jgi:3',5'-cyclic AMP phosphodiesterase CpdA